MKVFITIIAVLLTTSAFGQGEGWYDQNSTATGNSGGIFFLNKDTGWVSFTDGLFRSVNGGDTWVQVSQFPAYYLHFSDAINGWAMGDSSLYKTVDAGFNWISIHSPIVGRLQVFAKDTLYITNGYLDKFAGSMDGGGSWLTSDIPGLQNTIHFGNSRIGFVAGSQSTWLGDPPPAKGTKGASFGYSIDGGKIWHAKYCSLQENINTIYTISDSVVYAASSGIYYSNDAGNTWNTQYAKNLTHGFYDFYFVDKLHGTAVGGPDIIHTTNGGQSWGLQNSTVTTYLNNVFFIDSLTGWASGEKGVIVHTINGGKTWIRQYLFTPLTTSVSPEPFGRKTTITYELPSATKVKIRIYDVMGKELEVLESPGIQDAGTHSIEFDGSKYPEGMFYYRLEAPGVYGFGKMTKVVY